MIKLWKKAPHADRMLFSASAVCLALSMSLLLRAPDALAQTAVKDEEFLRFVDLAAEIYTEIKAKYVEEVDSREVLEASLAGMFTALDEHSQYMQPKSLENLNKDTGGSFSGIGIHITQRQGLLTVIAPIPGTPAARAGLMPWDRIIEIDGETTEGMTLTDAVDRLTGPTGTQVTIKIFREGTSEPIEHTITRATIKIESVYYTMHEGKIGYARIAKFSEETASDLRKAILDLKSQGMEGFVLDLRFNTGGLLREAIEVADLFVPKPEIIVSTKGRLRSQNKEYRAEQDPIINLPMFVLVNEGSASASEIVAGALQDHHLAVLIGPEGKNTFGKGSVQTIEPLRHSMYEDEDGNPKESAIRLTTAKYYVPSGRTIHHVGITPDIGVALPKGHESELLRHGLYGDTTIPLTKEEKEALEKAKAAAQEQEAKEGEAPEGTPGTPSIRLQNEEPAAEPTPAPEAGSTEPFYTNVKTPELANDDFQDIMLNEALKQMKIYMILERRGSKPTNIAAAGAEAGDPVAK